MDNQKAGARAVVIYARTSTNDGRQSLDTQLLPCRNRVAAEGSWKGLEVVEVVDEAPGAGAKRPGYDRMCGLLQEGKVAAVVTYDASRLSRSLADLLRFVEIVQKVDAHLLVLNGALPVNSRDPVFVLTLSILGAVSEFERQLLKARTRAGLQRARAEGKVLGNVPITKDQEDSILEARRRGESLNRIAMTQGRGLSAVTRVLAERGDPLGKLGSRGGKRKAKI